MKFRLALAISLLLSLIILIIATGVGSVFISPGESFSIISHKIFRTAIGDEIPLFKVGIIWSLRLPRVLLAWIAGAALAVSGAVMQSVLKNPLASSFTLGVSAGASLGAGLVILTGLTLPFSGMFTIPVAGFLFSLAAMFVVMRFSHALDPRLDSNTIILSGMVLSLLINAILTLLSALSGESINRLIMWQMGSFALKGWSPVQVLFPTTIAGILLVFLFSRELDIMTFGDEEASAIGVPVVIHKRILITLASLLTGCTISFVGVVGFLDLAVPHIVRRILGPTHRRLIPFSAIFGGALMVLSDLAARTLIPPLDLPVGAITAVVGAPVFGWIYFSSRKR